MDFVKFFVEFYADSNPITTVTQISTILMRIIDILQLGYDVGSFSRSLLHLYLLVYRNTLRGQYYSVIQMGQEKS